MHAGALHVRLNKRRVKLQRFVEIRKSRVAVASEVAESTAHVVRQCFALVKAACLNGLLERLRSLGVTLACTELDSLETLAQEILTAALREVSTLFETFGKTVVAERLQVVGDESGRRELLVLALHDRLGLDLSNLLKQTLYGLRRSVVAELVDDAAGGVVEEGFAETALLLVGVCSSVKGLDVLRVDRNSGSGVLNDLRPVAHRVPAGGTVGVEDSVGFAENGLAVQVNGTVVVLASVGLVASGLELRGIVFPLLLAQ